MKWLNQSITPPNHDIYLQAIERQNQLAKPSGALGRLETLAAQLAAMQNKISPQIDNIWISIFAADHGVVEEVVSAYPQSATAAMVKNIIQQGAAANVLAQFNDAYLEVIDVGMVQPVFEADVIQCRAGYGAANFCQTPAMTEIQLEKALYSGRAAVFRALQRDADLFIGGEMGIGNTSSASAIASTILRIDLDEITGAGSGISDSRIIHKIKRLQHALDLHQTHLQSPLKILQYLGGFEIAALCGAYIFAAQKGLPVLVDGFIASAAALCATTINPGVAHWFIFAHQSHEKGHQHLLKAMRAKPILDLDMRLGEGSGALVAIPILQMACRLHNEMATFEHAQIPTC